MKVIQGVLRSLDVGLLRGFQQLLVLRNFSVGPAAGSDNNQSTDTSESADDFERRIFGDISGSGQSLNSFYQKLDRAEKAYDRSGLGSKLNAGTRPGSFVDSLDDSFNTLSDGMDGKLKKSATYFEWDQNEVEKEDYTFRADMNFWEGMTYDTKDLDLTKPGVYKPFKRDKFKVTTKEVLKNADFRKVQFLANFITEAGIIIKRSQTGISAKAQRKVAREIKTARAFGLMPYTTMGTKRFAYGKTMEDLDEDFEYETFGTPNFVNTKAN